MFDKDALEYLVGSHKPLDYVLADEAQSQVVAVAAGVRLESLERFQDTPDRIRAVAKLSSSDSFCEYINRFKSTETSVYIDVDSGVFAAYLDHHGKKPSWCTHVAQFAPKQSREWRAWVKVHEQWQNQLAFALLIEQMLDTIAEPEPNLVLKAALDFQANENLALGSAHNLDDGTTRFTFVKDNVNKAVTFPHRITLVLPIHENEETALFEARIRYKADGNGALAFKFSFVKDPGTIERDAMLRLAEKTKAETKGLAHYEGSLAARGSA